VFASRLPNTLCEAEMRYSTFNRLKMLSEGTAFLISLSNVEFFFNEDSTDLTMPGGWNIS
jgi:hypothetical protein